ncbi:SigE family RNA polymerase sigma factor [Actinospongicola halichondriae]|uniref:SigE family RNA polymerase sigma factor n=1 Tax=Actinospongicola halichondriae TaxID=3236844 RepID=UPI003D5853EF
MATMAIRSDGTDGPGLDPWLVDLYRTEYRRLVRLATMLVDEVGLAEELVQDAFVAVAGARERQALRDPSAAAAYLRTAVANRARSQLRKRRVRRRHLRSVESPPSAPAADGPVLAADDSQRMLQALERLPERQRQVLVLRYYGDLSEAEIASALGISAGTVKTHAHRGLAALEEQMTQP